MMLCSSKTTSKELIIQMIKDQQHQIKLDTKEIKELTLIIAERVKELEKDNEISNVEVISYPPYR